MNTDLFHGAHTAFSAHEGQCWTDCDEAANRYAQHSGPVAYMTIDLSALNIEECEGYDYDENSAPADSFDFRAAAAARGVDVLVYDDCDEQGREHTCYRLVSERAVAMARRAVILDRDEYDDLVLP